MLEKWELANYKPEHTFVVGRYMIGKGHSVSVLGRGGEVDTIFGFKKGADALEWIREKSQARLLGQRTMSWRFLSDACNPLNWLWAQIDFGRK
jgi:hypothetical protein